MIPLPVLAAKSYVDSGILDARLFAAQKVDGCVKYNDVTAAAAVDLPAGSYILFSVNGVVLGSVPLCNAQVFPRARNGQTYVVSGSGSSALYGVWRSCGVIMSSVSDDGSVLYTALARRSRV
jgi:hypothetical protein